jgi:hypothetical protein
MISPDIGEVYRAVAGWVQRHSLIQTVLSGITVSSLITLGLAYVKNKSDNVERAFSLHREFSSFEFIKARDQAYSLLAKNRQLSFRELAHDERFEEQLVYVTRILTFYEHLSISLRNEYVDRKAGCRFFGMVFVWWYCVYFNTDRGLKSVTWEVNKDIHALYSYFERHADPKDFVAWLKNTEGGSSYEQALDAKAGKDKITL